VRHRRMPGSVFQGARIKTLTVSPIRIKEIGRVKAVKKAIATVAGLSNFMNGQLVEFASGTKGLIVGFNEEEMLILILGEESTVRIGQDVYSAQEEFKIPVGEGFIGRIVNALAEPLDGKGPITPRSEYYAVFRDAPDTMDRGAVTSCLETGTKIIDAIIPISKGQCELIIGDRMTGKTTICLDAILNQKGNDVICIYCCIGKSFSSLLKAAHIFKAKGAFDYTIVVAAPAAAVVGEQYLAPYSACSLGEYFMHKGRDVLIVFDDMTKHAWSYRQLSLLLERPPGREAYPGDIYYTHSQLIERGGKLNKE
jgi:F-type H+-transporting ATPase subunit alpha